MSSILIYHNPRWSKSRESVKILEKSDKEFEIIDILNAVNSISKIGKKKTKTQEKKASS